MSIIRSPLLWPLLAFLLIATALLGFWTARKINPITGDEPHYLVMASGLVHHRTFEQTEAYRDEFRTNRLSPDSPLAPKDAAPTASTTSTGPDCRS